MTESDRTTINKAPIHCGRFVLDDQDLEAFRVSESPCKSTLFSDKSNVYAVSIIVGTAAGTMKKWMSVAYGSWGTTVNQYFAIADDTSTKVVIFLFCSFFFK